MTSATLPPPLSDAPSVVTLERLLAGLNQPVQRGVPSPPKAAPSAPTSEPPAATRHVAPPVESATVAQPPSLTWSAAHARRRLRTPTATTVRVALATVAGVVAGLAAAGEILP